MPPSIFLISFYNFTAYYIVVGIVAFIVIGFQIWLTILILKSKKLNDSIQTKLNQLYKCKYPIISHKGELTHNEKRIINEHMIKHHKKISQIIKSMFVRSE